MTNWIEIIPTGCDCKKDSDQAICKMHIKAKKLKNRGKIK